MFNPLKTLFGDIRFQIRLRWRQGKLILRRIIRFFTTDLWRFDENIHQLSKFRTRVLVDLRVVMVFFLSFAKRKIAFQATALAFRTILALVPMLAVALFVLGQLGFDDVLIAFLEQSLPNETLSNLLLGAAKNLLATSTTGLFGFVSAFSFFWILIWLMLQVVKVFDNVWGNIRKRSLLKNLVSIFALLFFGPLVILIFIAGFLFVGQVMDYLIPGESGVKTFLNWFTLGVLVVLIFTLVYKLIPSAKVRLRYAFRAALFSGIAFTLLQFLYFGTQLFLTAQSAVYGYLAAVPLFMVWLNLGWTVILLGAELTYALQVVHRRDITVRELDEFIARNRADAAAGAHQDDDPLWLIQNLRKKTTN